MEISEKHFVTGNNIRPPHPDGFLELRVGMGCFWGPEKIFWELEGVHATSVGYSGDYFYGRFIAWIKKTRSNEE